MSKEIQQNDYSLLDSGDGRKLEKFGPYRLIRPAAQAIWRPKLPPSEWERADGSFARKVGGDGHWDFSNKKLPKEWPLLVSGIRFVIRLTDFGHLGIFPEQASNWAELDAFLRQRVSAGEKPRVLNLFAYTGGSTLACALAGAEVTHLDASKTSVAWARENAAASGADALPVRWIIDDANKYIEREVKRGSKYDGVILDPPSFGRGAKGEIWKLEEHLMPLLDKLPGLMQSKLGFVMLSAHSPGVTPIVLKNMMMQIFGSNAGTYDASEMLLMDKSGEAPLASGANCTLWGRDWVASTGARP